MTIQLESPAFKEGEPIPPRYSCEDVNISPPLNWGESEIKIPEDGSLAIIVDDPDAPRGTWVHWVIFNLPPQTASLPEMIMPVKNGKRCIQGTNSLGTIGYVDLAPLKERIDISSKYMH
jgi:Raf kinase inhibitor-like YbhB/YbcL family protein